MMAGTMDQARPAATIPSGAAMLNATTVVTSRRSSIFEKRSGRPHADRTSPVKNVRLSVNAERHIAWTTGTLSPHLAPKAIGIIAAEITPIPATTGSHTDVAPITKRRYLALNSAG